MQLKWAALFVGALAGAFFAAIFALLLYDQLSTDEFVRDVRTAEHALKHCESGGSDCYYRPEAVERVLPAAPPFGTHCDGNVTELTYEKAEGFREVVIRCAGKVVRGEFRLTFDSTKSSDNVMVGYAYFDPAASIPIGKATKPGGRA